MIKNHNYSMPEDDYIREVKVTKTWFNLAKEGQYIPGEIIRGGGIRVPVGVVLGSAQKYRGKRLPGTEYKLFRGCRLHYAEDTVKRDRKEFIKALERYSVQILLWC